MTVADLQRRGWTDHLIRFLVPPPVEGQTATGGATEPLWTPEAIIAVEARPEFQAALLRALWERPRTDVTALRCPLSVERLTAGWISAPAQVLVEDVTKMSEAGLLYLGNRHDKAEALAEYNRRRRLRGRLTLEVFHALCRPSMPTPDIITEEHRRATDRALRTLWEVEEDTGAKVLNSGRAARGDG